MKQQTVYTRLDDNLLNIIKDVYVFTLEERLAHDKQVASDAFEAGRRFGECIDSFFETVFENKEQYLEGINNKYLNTIPNEIKQVVSKIETTETK